ncbi:MAG: two-component system response regulator, partial [Methylovirgula sp.]
MKTDPQDTGQGARVETFPSLGDSDTDKTLLIVDDDRPFLSRLSRAMEGRGFIVTAVQSVAEGLA